MSDRTKRILPSLLMALLFAGSVLLVMPTTAFPTNAHQRAAAEVALGEGEPIGGFQAHATDNRFWPDGPATGSGPVFYTDGAALAATSLSPAAPADDASAPEYAGQTPATGNKVARIGGGTGGVARFPMPENLATVDTMQLLGVNAKILAACDLGSLYTRLPGQSSSAGAPSITLSMIVQKQSGGNWADDRTISTTALRPDGFVWARERITTIGDTPYAVQMFRGSSVEGDLARLTGDVVNPGERLVAQYSIGTPATVGLQCFLYYGARHMPGGVTGVDACPISVLSNTCPRAEYSEIILTTDAARLAVYTTDADGVPRSAFPSADSIDSSERRIVVEAIYASAFGPGIIPQLTDLRHANVRLQDLDKNQFLYYVDNTDETFDVRADRPTGGFPREFDIQTIRLISGRADDLYPKPDVVQDLGQSVLRRSYVFAYNATQPDVKRLQAEFYSYTDKWTTASPLAAIGGKGITFGLVPGETLTHSINPLEPTQFTFFVRNVGSAADVVTVTASAPGGGWTATVLGGGKYFLGPGAVAIGQVEVMPPASAGSGSRSVQLRAVSSFPDVDDPATLTLTTTLTDAVTHDVDLTADSLTFAVKQGATKSFPITVSNRGSGRDSFVVIPSLPSNVQGYQVTVSPASLQLVAGGSQQLTVTIKAPAEIPTITSWTLGLTAVAVGNSAVSDRIDALVSLVPVEQLDLVLHDANIARRLRQQSPECLGSPVGTVNDQGVGLGLVEFTECNSTPGGDVGRQFVDGDFDASALFRVTLHNRGDLPESYRVEGVWDPTVEGTQNENGCDGDPTNGVADGIPDGWRFNWNEDVGKGIPANRQTGVGFHSSTGQGFSGKYQLSPLDKPIVVPAHTTRDVYLEIGHIEYACSGGPIVLSPVEVFPECRIGPACSEVASMRVTVSSIRDPARTMTFPATVRMDAPGEIRGTDRYSGGIHLPGVEAVNGTTVGRTLLGSSATLDIKAINKGNEHDDLVISVAGDSRWSHRLVVVSSAPAGQICDLPSNEGTTIRCNGMGVYDEVRIQVVATPGPQVRVGDSDAITVKVSSGDAPGIERTLNLVAQATGTFAFNTAPLGSTARSVAPGATVSFPFFIQNTGTSGDSYRMSLLTGSNSWNPVLSSSAPVFVPSGHNVPAYLTVKGPIGSTAGTTDVFKVQVESVGNLAKRTFEVSPTVQPAGGLVVAAVEGADVLISTRGVETPVTLRATPTTGAATGSATFTVDGSSLPPGWAIDRLTASAPFSTTAGQPTVSEAVFKVTAPANALGSARGILHVDVATAGTSPLRGAADVGLNVASTFGLQLNVTNGETQVIAPGGPAIFNLTLTNLGLGSDTVLMTNTALPTGWRLLFSPPAVTVGPLETVDVQVEMRAPTTAQPADIASVIVFAGSVNDPGTLVSLPLQAQVGFNAIRVEATGPVLKGAPQETLVQVLNVTNNGTLLDQVRLVAVLDTLGVSNQITSTLEPSLVSLKPGETVQVTLTQVFGPRIPSDIGVQTSIVARSLLDERPEPLRASAVLPVTTEVLPYVATDVDGDGLPEYAVDRNDDASDGFEQFRPTLTPGGSTQKLTSPDLTSFLRNEARESLMVDVTLANGTVVRTLVLKIDGDRDGKTDLFIDRDGDNQPDFYWDPDANKASPIEFRKDINGDQVPESFVDTNGDGAIDAVYDLTRGRFTDVLQIDVDGDGQLDYVIDRNGNGQADQDETVLYTRGGALLIVQKVDVDGDGRLDQVFDVNGDGAPDYFIPAGTTKGIDIVMRDVNNDGVQDWTFDGDGDGRRESYYDPVTGKAHVIDAAGHFGDSLKEYWYIGVLFAIVIGLFAALVMVTRR